MKQNNEFLRHNVSLQFLKECFRYEDGRLIWNIRPRHHFDSDWSWKRFNNHKAGTYAETFDTKSGYYKVNIRLNGKKFKTSAHRIIWYITHNEVPHVIDHIDRNKLNNNISNLRNTSDYENSINRADFKGTCFHKASGKWVAQTTVNKKRIHIGLYNSEWEAIQAYREFIKEHKGVDLNKQFVHQDIANWFKIAKPNPNNKDIIVQLSCVYEEVTELLESINLPESDKAIKALKDLVICLRNSTTNLNLTKENSVKLLDALEDIKVTAIGLATFLGMDFESALVEVNKSNYSKFVEGKPILNQDGKIMKGNGYFKPNLEKFV